ncbi:UNVERIFIED_CONTAM: hypothetical protein K2H54_029463 [Gekko kuhli]
MIWESGSKRSGTPESRLPQSWGGKPAGGREKPWGGGGVLSLSNPMQLTTPGCLQKAALPAVTATVSHAIVPKRSFTFGLKLTIKYGSTQTSTGVELLVEGPLNVACEGNVSEDLYFPQVLHDPLS